MLLNSIMNRKETCVDPDQKAEKPADLNLHYLQHQVYLGSAW